MTAFSRTTILQKGSKGSEVKQLQITLNDWLVGTYHERPLVEDGIFGSATEAIVKFFQCHHFLQIDGIVGDATRVCLERGVAALPILKLGSQGTVVRRLQSVLHNYGINPGPQDGIYGPKTRTAVIQFQHDYQIVDRTDDVIGEVGFHTWVELVHGPAGKACEYLRR